MDVCSWVRDGVPFAAMVMAECSHVGMTTVSKAAMSRGTSNFVLVVYSNGLATLILLPCLIIHRTNRPPLTFSLLSRFFLLGLIGICGAQTLAFTGIRYSSPTLASAMGNITPAFTFILAIIFRMEKLELRSSSSQAKTLGAIVSITGACVVTLYKGPPVMMTASPHHELVLAPQSNWIIGGLFLSATCLLVAVWNILQAATVKEYPAELTIVFFYCFFGTIQCALVSLIAERDPIAWRLKPDMELIAIVYSAVLGSVMNTIIHTWCLRKKGPVYVAMFRPLGIAIAAIMGVIFLGDTLHIGILIGSIIIAVGFYAVIWGKSKEDKISEGNGVSSLESSTHKVPLLQSKTEEI